MRSRSPDGAERLFVAQPSLSQQIKALERELGGQLLERLPNGVRLTAAGKALVLEELADRAWVLFGPEHGLTELVLQVSAAPGFAPRRTVQTGQVVAAAHLAAAGLGVTILPDNAVPNGLDALSAD